MKRRYRTGHVLSLLCAALLLTACAGEDAKAGQEEAWQDVFPITGQDERTQPQEPWEVNLDACGKDRVLLTQAGDIWLSGSLEGGQVVVDVDEDELVHLYLAGVNISSGQGPAILIKEASKVIVTLVSGTENVLSDSPDYTGYEESRACLYSVSDLTINGEGILRVYGYHEDGVRSKDRIRLLGANIEVQAKGDGVRGNDGILAVDMTLDIQSEQNGLRTANQGADGRGAVQSRGG
ncbi:MAG: carbohydrate-binding domain-containing protein, partial [Lachnospiraceae bacterium]|nr:carbohydrate-binding domain-containing protein [Lachnospiraceae bacterium]